MLSRDVEGVEVSQHRLELDNHSSVALRVDLTPDLRGLEHQLCRSQSWLVTHEYTESCRVPVSERCPRFTLYPMKTRLKIRHIKMSSYYGSWKVEDPV